MAEEGFLLGATALKQVEALIRRVQSQYWNPNQQRGRWQQQNASNYCAPRYNLIIYWQPTSGTCTISVKYDGTTESFTFAYNATHDDVLAAINAHTKFVLHSVTAGYVGAGSFPTSNMILALPDGATITAHSSSLVSGAGSPVAEFRVEICGCT